MEKVEKKKSRTYTAEFRKQAVQLAEELGSIAKAAKQLGVAHANLHNWRHKVLKVSALTPAQVSAEDELKRLRKENAELKKVNYILKAAAAVFSQGHLS